MTAHRNVGLVRSGFEAFNRRDFDAALELMDESITWAPTLATETTILPGKQALRESWVSQVDAVNVYVEPQELIPVGDSAVIAIAKFSGRGRSSGAPFEETRVLTCYVEHGKLVLGESQRTRTEALEAAGMHE